jgi:uncharacterized protein YbbK (DUF523 family)
MEDKIRLGISACLLGRPVRYDAATGSTASSPRLWAALLSSFPVCRRSSAVCPCPRGHAVLVGDRPRDPRWWTSKTGQD